MLNISSLSLHFILSFLLLKAAKWNWKLRKKKKEIFIQKGKEEKRKVIKWKRKNIEMIALTEEEKSQFKIRKEWTKS